MKKINVLCIAGALFTGSLFAAPLRLKKAPLIWENKISSLTQAKKKSGGNWEEGNMLFAIGYGFPNLPKSLLKESAGELNYKATGFGPMHFRFEYALSESWGLGFSSNFNKYGASYDEQGTGYDTLGNPIYTMYNYKFDVTAINFLVRFNKHWAAGSKADIFSGFGVGYSYRGWKWTTTDPNFTDSSGDNPIPVGFEWTLGVRIFFTPNIAGYVEAGYAKDIIQAGICYKIGS